MFSTRLKRRAENVLFIYTNFYLFIYCVLFLTSVLNLVTYLFLQVESDQSVKMPAGVSWARYVRMLGASVLAMFAGAQAVHQYYLPDLVRDKIKP